MRDECTLSNAIRSYQKAHGLKADGLVNEDLLVHILASMNDD